VNRNKPHNSAFLSAFSRRQVIISALKTSALAPFSGLFMSTKVFASGGDNPELKFHSDVYVWFPDGKVKNLTPMPGIYYQSCINLDGTHVLFSGNSSGSPRIWQADIQTGKITSLTSDDHAARHAVYSWLGDRIMFSSDQLSGQPPEQIKDMDSSGLPPEGHTVNLFSMDRDGKNVQQVTFGPFQDQRPCFSPDGKTAVFISNRTGTPFTLWSVALDGRSEPSLLAEIKSNEINYVGHPAMRKDIIYRPWYSTDGTKIFVFAHVNGRHQICSVPADGGEITPLANDDIGMSHGPFSDPDGKNLLMHSTRDGTWGIWELPLNGGEPRRLDPPGFETAGHATRSRNGIMAFDVVGR